MNNEIEILQKKIKDREAEILRIRTHENCAAVLLDQKLNPEERYQFSTLCNEIAKLNAEIERLKSLVIEEQARVCSYEELLEIVTKQYTYDNIKLLQASFDANYDHYLGNIRLMLNLNQGTSKELLENHINDLAAHYGVDPDDGCCQGDLDE